MANTDVSLDVRNFPATRGDGYTDTTATNNAVYSYQFGGGSDGHGNTDETVGSGSATITVSLHSDPRYTITGVTISGDIQNQLSYAPPGNGATSVVITDTDTATGSGYYKINVADSIAGCTFICDPSVTNKPQ